MIGTKYLDYKNHGGAEHSVAEIIEHDGFNNPKNDDNDIAMLRLEIPIELTRKEGNTQKTVARIVGLSTEVVAPGTILELGRL